MTKKMKFILGLILLIIFIFLFTFKSGKKIRTENTGHMGVSLWKTCEKLKKLNLSNGLTSDMSIEFKNDLIIEPAKVKEFAFAYQSACEDGDHWNVVTTDVYEVLPMEKYSASLHSFLKNLNVSCKPKNQGFHILGFHLESPQNYEYDLTDESCTISGIR